MDSVIADLFTEPQALAQTAAVVKTPEKSKKADSLPADSLPTPVKLAAPSKVTVDYNAVEVLLAGSKKTVPPTVSEYAKLFKRPAGKKKKKTKKKKAAAAKKAAAKKAAAKKAALPQVGKNKLRMRLHKKTSGGGAVVLKSLDAGAVVKKVFKSSPRRLHYNRVYHATRLRLENGGMEAEEAKSKAIEAAHASCESEGLHAKQVSVDEW